MDNISAQNSAPTHKSRYRRDTYALQVQAFLNAADEVDVDEETIEDILDGYEGKIDLLEEEDVDVVVSSANSVPPAYIGRTEEHVQLEDDADESDEAEDDPEAQLEQLADEEEGKFSVGAANLRIRG